MEGESWSGWAVTGLETLRFQTKSDMTISGRFSVWPQQLTEWKKKSGLDRGPGVGDKFICHLAQRAFQDAFEVELRRAQDGPGIGDS